MDKFDDYIDKVLYEYINGITFSGLSEKEIKNIVANAKKKKRIETYLMVAVLSFLLIMSLSCIYLSKNDFLNRILANNEENKTDMNINEIDNKKISDTVTFSLGDINSSNITIADDEAVEEYSNIYVIKLENILSYSIINNEPKTKLKGTIIKTIKGSFLGNVEFTLDGGVFNICDINNMNLNIDLDDKYNKLTEKEKNSTYINVVPEGIAVPEIDKTYLVSLDNNNNVIYSTIFSFLEYDTDKELYKLENKWMSFEN